MNNVKIITLKNDIENIKKAKDALAQAKINLIQVVREICNRREYINEDGDTYESVETISLLKDDLVDLILRGES